MRISLSRTLFLALALLGVPKLALAAPRKPIVAVFSIEAKGVSLEVAALDRLTAYLSSSLAATGRYEVVPRDQVKSRLRKQKASSHKRCYDQSCQIEIGKELAAQKSLATQIIKLGTHCGVTGTLFDLRRAAAEGAATVRGGCSEDAIVSSLETMVKKLAGNLGGSGKPEKLSWTSDRATQRGPHGASDRPRDGAVEPGAGVSGKASLDGVAVTFRSTPPGAAAYLNGRKVALTNSTVSVRPGTYVFFLSPPSGYQSYKSRITISRPRTLDITLVPGSGTSGSLGLSGASGTLGTSGTPGTTQTTKRHLENAERTEFLSALERPYPNSIRCISASVPSETPAQIARSYPFRASRSFFLPSSFELRVRAWPGGGSRRLAGRGARRLARRGGHNLENSVASAEFSRLCFENA